MAGRHFLAANAARATIFRAVFAARTVFTGGATPFRITSSAGLLGNYVRTGAQITHQKCCGDPLFHGLFFL